MPPKNNIPDDLVPVEQALPDDLAPVAQALPDDLEPVAAASQQPQGIFEAAKAGFADNLTGMALRATGAMEAPTYEPQGAAEQAAYWGANLVADPAAIALGGVAGRVALKATGLMSKAQRLNVLSNAAKSKPAVQAMSRAVGTAAGAVEGAAAGGSVSAAQGAIEQLEQGQFDPAALAFQSAFGTVAGSGAGALVGRMGANKANKLAQLRKDAQNIYEGNLVFSKELDTIDLAKGAEGLGPQEAQAIIEQNRQKMSALHNKISVSESAREGALAKAATAQTAEESQKWQLKAAEHLVEGSRWQNEFNDAFGGDSYQKLMKAKRAYGDTKIRLADGTEAPAFDYAINKSGVVIDPDTAKAVMSVKDITPRMGGIFSVKDPIRMLTEAEGLGGPVRRVLMDGIEAGEVAAQQEFSSFAAQFEKLAKAAGIKRFTWSDKLPGSGGRGARDTSSKVFDAIESGDLSKLSPSERQLGSFIQVHYENMLNEVNKVRLANNLKPIAKRKNYISHITELQKAAEAGIDVGTSNVLAPDASKAGAIKTRFEKQRTGADAIKDVYTAVTSYTQHAMRIKHLTRPRQQALALVELMDNAPNLQAGLTRFLNGPVFGGLGHIDSIAAANGANFALDFADKFSGMIGRSTIPGNLKIMLEQASQTLPTVVQTGPISAMAGVKAVISGIPDDVRKLSKVLAQRDVAASEGGHQLGRHARNVVGTGLTWGEKLASSSANFADSKMAEFSWASAFNQAKRTMQLSDKAAALYADDIARSMNAVYRDLYRPALLQNRTVKALWPFQTFSFNLWNTLTTDSKALAKLRGTSQTREVAKLLGAMEATNFIYGEFLGGRRPFDFGAIDVFNYGANEDGITFRDKPLADLPNQPLSRIAADVLPSVGPVGLSNAPLAAQFVGEGAGAARAAYNLAFNEDRDIEELKKEFDDKAARFGSRFITYGSQIYKTRKAYKALQEGFTTIGKEEVALDPSRDTLPGLVYGTSSMPSVQDARKERAR